MEASEEDGKRRGGRKRGRRYWTILDKIEHGHQTVRITPEEEIVVERGTQACTPTEHKHNKRMSSPDFLRKSREEICVGNMCTRASCCWLQEAAAGGWARCASRRMSMHRTDVCAVCRSAIGNVIPYTDKHFIYVYFQCSDTSYGKKKKEKTKKTGMCMCVHAGYRIHCTHGRRR